MACGSCTQRPATVTSSVALEDFIEKGPHAAPLRAEAYAAHPGPAPTVMHAPKRCASRNVVTHLSQKPIFSATEWPQFCGKVIVSARGRSARPWTSSRLSAETAARRRSERHDPFP
ncbi:hypothetical protein BVI1335_2630012 [Burkholderia vietnamiensis]|nr:hypothetical protein BVI1335_2630012 [Burkholderia vietnamiensis]